MWYFLYKKRSDLLLFVFTVVLVMIVGGARSKHYWDQKEQDHDVAFADWMRNGHHGNPPARVIRPWWSE
jgi:hypothetical protein